MERKQTSVRKAATERASPKNQLKGADESVLVKPYQPNDHPHVRISVYLLQRKAASSFCSVSYT